MQCIDIYISIFVCVIFTLNEKKTYCNAWYDNFVHLFLSRDISLYLLLSWLNWQAYWYWSEFILLSVFFQQLSYQFEVSTYVLPKKIYYHIWGEVVFYPYLYTFCSVPFLKASFPRPLQHIKILQRFSVTLFLLLYYL